jgi:hypothetical protein
MSKTRDLITDISTGIRFYNSSDVQLSLTCIWVVRKKDIHTRSWYLVNSHAVKDISTDPFFHPDTQTWFVVRPGDVTDDFIPGTDDPDRTVRDSNGRVTHMELSNCDIWTGIGRDGDIFFSDSDVAMALDNNDWEPYKDYLKSHFGYSADVRGPGLRVKVKNDSGTPFRVGGGQYYGHGKPLGIGAN